MPHRGPAQRRERNDIIEIATTNGISYSDAVYHLEVSVAAYCTQYGSQTGP